jgi:hypothetical protein
MDQSLPAAPTIDVLHQGEEFQGASVLTINGPAHPLYPKPVSR